MPIENVTPNRGYELPAAPNDLIDDVARLIAAIMKIDFEVASLFAALATKAEGVHEHVIADITGLAAALAARQEMDQKGQANGYAGLGSDGKVPAAQLPATLFGALTYQGTWNASTNSPTIPAANTANKGHYYKVSVAGTTTISGVNDWEVGDWIVSNGVTWDKIDNTDQVLSVAGLRGTITAGALITALGLKAAALLDVGTAANTVAAGDDSRIAGAVQKNGGALTGGFTAPNAMAEGTLSSGTYTPNPTTNNWRRVVNGGNFTLAAPSVAGSYNMTIDITNGASAGAITFTGFATGHPKGDALTTINGDKFKLHIAKSYTGVTGMIEALQ